MDKRELVAVGLGSIFVGACVWALWDRLDAILLLAAASPVAASFMFPKGTNLAGRMLIGALIDVFLGALAFVPVVGDLIDVGASVVAIVLLVVRFRQFATSLPGGLACALLFIFLWFESGFLPHSLSAANVHHAFWYYLVMIVAVALIGAAIIAVLAVLLGLYYDGDRAQAVFCTVGFPWYLITFFLTIFLPNRQVKHAHQAAKAARRSGY